MAFKEEVVSTRNLLDVVAEQTQIYPNILKHYVKTYAKYLIAGIDNYIYPFTGIISAYFIYEGNVYMDGDATQFTTNHKKLWAAVHSLSLNEVYD